MRALVLALLLVSAGAPALAAAEPPTTHEVLTDRPSGFWTSNRPAINGAYRYRLLLIGIVICGATAFLLVRTLRRASADRNGRAG